MKPRRRAGEIACGEERIAEVIQHDSGRGGGWILVRTPLRRAGRAALRERVRAGVQRGSARRLRRTPDASSSTRLSAIVASSRSLLLVSTRVAVALWRKCDRLSQLTCGCAASDALNRSTSSAISSVPPRRAPSHSSTACQATSGGRDSGGRGAGGSVAPPYLSPPSTPTPLHPSLSTPARAAPPRNRPPPPLLRSNRQGAPRGAASRREGGRGTGARCRPPRPVARGMPRPARPAKGVRPEQPPRRQAHDKPDTCYPRPRD